jgi:hypothetical protein
VHKVLLQWLGVGARVKGGYKGQGGVQGSRVMGQRLVQGLVKGGTPCPNVVSTDSDQFELFFGQNWSELVLELN